MQRTQHEEYGQAHAYAEEASAALECETESLPTQETNLKYEAVEACTLMKMQSEALTHQ